MANKFVLNQEDGTVAGGNLRGEYAVDLQMSRTNITDVSAAPYSSILGGKDNEMNGGCDYAVIAGGLNNRLLNSGGLYTVISGGKDNSMGDAAYGVVAGGISNSVSSGRSVVSGGANNVASTNSYATVVGGYQNSSTGQYSVSGGYSNVASGEGAVALGYDNTASGTRSVAIGGNNTASGNYAVAFGTRSTASGHYSFSMGSYNSLASGTGSFCFGGADTKKATATASTSFHGYAYLRNQFACGDWSGFNPNIQNSAQYSNLISFKLDTLTTGATTTLSLDGTGTTELIIPDGTNRVWNVTVETVAVVTSITGTADGVSVGDSLLQNDIILFSKIGGTSSVVGTNNTQFISSTSLSTALMGYSAGASQELALTFTAPTFTGGGSVTMRVVSKVSLVEVAY